MSDRPITWADLTLSGAEAHARPANTYELAVCPSCTRQLADGVVTRRLPEQTYHRNLADARAGVRVIRACPKCGRELPAAAGCSRGPLGRRNRPN